VATRTRSDVSASRRLLGGVIGVAVVLFVALALAYPAGGLVTEVDARTAEWVAANMPTWIEWIARGITRIGGGLVLPALALGAAAWLWLAGRRAASGFLVSVLVLVNLAVWLLKLGFDRPRPDEGSAIQLPASPSFPSGHAANGVAVFGALGLIAAARAGSARARRWWAIGGFAFGVAVGVTRVVLGVHWVSDVLAGYCVGVAVLCGVLLVGPLLVRAPSARPGTIVE